MHVCVALDFIHIVTINILYISFLTLTLWLQLEIVSRNSMFDWRKLNIALNIVNLLNEISAVSQIIYIQAIIQMLRFPLL